MDVVKRWLPRVGAATAAALAVWLLPAAAWANSRPGVVAAGGELARRRPRTGGLGLVGCCCLVVVIVVVVIVVLITRRRQRQPPPPPPPQYPQ